MKFHPLHSERAFAQKLCELVKEYRGKLRPGERAFWLLAGALAVLNEESGQTPPYDTACVPRSGFARAAELTYDKLTRYL